MTNQDKNSVSGIKNPEELNSSNTGQPSPDSKSKVSDKGNSVPNSEFQIPNSGHDPLKPGGNELLDIIAPSAFVITPNWVQLNNLYVRTFFVYTYPRYLNTNWLSPVINFDMTLDISMFVYPVETGEVSKQLRQKQTMLESTLSMEKERGMVRDPELETAIQDIDSLRDILQKGESRIFRYSLYFTLYASSPEELNTLTHQLESTLGGMLIYTKQSFLQQEEGFSSSVPIGIDDLQVLRNLDTQSLSSAFPFTSATLTSNNGILYGINRHNNSLILFDRFDLDNANEVIFARSGAGKSYLVKLEALRYMMLGTDIIIIDPENEYKALAEAVGGSFISVSLNSDKRINPFDLPKITEGETGETILRSNVAMLTGLLALMVGSLTPDESGTLDKALYETYALKDITTDPATHANPPPLLQDLLEVLGNMGGAESLVKRLQKYVEGTFAGLFTKPTNFDLDKGMIVFSIRDLEEQLRPIGMYMILTYVWNNIRKELRRRLLLMDEAWLLMQHEDSAKFVHSLVKRARKYYLGVSVISQDVEDFMDSKYGRSIINNAALQILLKQSNAAVEKLAEVFGLTEGEKFLLQESDIGEGLFFAGQNHVAMKVIASYTEDQIITTDPKQLLAQKDNLLEGFDESGLGSPQAMSTQDIVLPPPIPAAAGMNQEAGKPNDELRIKNDDSKSNDELRIKNDDSKPNDELRIKNDDSKTNDELKIMNDESKPDNENKPSIDQIQTPPAPVVNDLSTTNGDPSAVSNNPSTLSGDPSISNGNPSSANGNQNNF